MTQQEKETAIDFSEQGASDNKALPKVSSEPPKVIAASDSQDIFAPNPKDAVALKAATEIRLSTGIILYDTYRLDKRLSQDELGETWMATDRKASENVIICLPPKEIRKDKLAAILVTQAAKRIAVLRHPRIVPVLGHFTDPEHGFFVVRKFINGNTLDIHRQHSKLEKTAIINILSNVALALDYAHSVGIVRSNASASDIIRKGIIHGGLCPKDILIAVDGEVYLDNFSLLPVQTSTERKPYLAPEVASGRAATGQSDVYSLAAIAYELLSGELPSSADSLDQIQPIPGVPSVIDDIFRRAMAKDPQDRYASCGAFIETLVESFQTLQKPNETTSNFSGVGLVAGAALLLVALIGGAVLFVPNLSRVPEQEVALQQEAAPQPAGQPIPALEAGVSQVPPLANLFEAAERGTVEDIRFFLGRAGRIDQRDGQGRTLLHIAAEHNSNVEVMQFLVAQGADINAVNNDGVTPLHVAARHNFNVEVVQYLASQSPDVPPFQSSLANIFQASREGTVGDVRYFLNRGVDVNVRAGNNRTPLCYAAWQNTDVEVLRFLVSQGADVSARCNEGRLPLHYAAWHNSNVEVLAYLVSQGNDVDVKTRREATSLHIAAEHNPNVEVLRYLISQGANVNTRRNNGQTPLDVANTEEKRVILRAAGGRRESEL